MAAAENDTFVFSALQFTPEQANLVLHFSVPLTDTVPVPAKFITVNAAAVARWHPA